MPNNLPISMRETLGKIWFSDPADGSSAAAGRG